MLWIKYLTSVFFFQSCTREEIGGCASPRKCQQPESLSAWKPCLLCLQWGGSELSSNLRNFWLLACLQNSLFSTFVSIIMRIVLDAWASSYFRTVLAASSRGYIGSGWDERLTLWLLFTFSKDWPRDWFNSSSLYTLHTLCIFFNFSTSVYIQSYCSLSSLPVHSFSFRFSIHLSSFGLNSACGCHSGICPLFPYFVSNCQSSAGLPISASLPPYM